MVMRIIMGNLALSAALRSARFKLQRSKRLVFQLAPRPECLFGAQSPEVRKKQPFVMNYRGEAGAMEVVRRGR